MDFSLLRYLFNVTFTFLEKPGLFQSRFQIAQYYLTLSGFLVLVTEFKLCLCLGGGGFFLNPSFIEAVMHSHHTSSFVSPQMWIL